MSPGANDRSSYHLGAAAEEPFNAALLRTSLLAAGESLWVPKSRLSTYHRGAAEIAGALAEVYGRTLQERWQSLEDSLGARRSSPSDPVEGEALRAGMRALIVTRAIRPSFGPLCTIPCERLLALLPDDDPWPEGRRELEAALAEVPGLSHAGRRAPLNLGLRLLISGGHERLAELCEGDLLSLPRDRRALGADGLDAALCQLGVFDRSPQRGFSRHRRVKRQPTPRELVEGVEMPARFRELTALYLEHARTRMGYAHSTLYARSHALARFWRFLAERFPEVRSAAEVRPEHGRAFRDWAVEHHRRTRRGKAGRQRDDRLTTEATLGAVRIFFHDVCEWALEEGSPFRGLAAEVPPLRHRDLANAGFKGVRARQQARMHARILDLERELPAIRAHAFACWHEAKAASGGTRAAERAEIRAFWRWALLELFVQSGLGIEEALELTALDILRRRTSDGSLYYLLFVKPSKHGRARTIPIGDGLGRVLAEIIRHVRRFYRSRHVPAIEGWDFHERVQRPRAPYLLQGAGNPRCISPTTVREQLKQVSLTAGARRADGSPLYFRPHDGRRVFASEQLNANTPVHVIQALLGHASLDTVMVYAKLYPRTLVEEYRKAVRGSFLAAYGAESLRNPTREEWEEFSRSCSLRDMGTHLCALPTGEHCPRGLVCLGCSHAQPKRSAAPVFRGMLASHRRELGRARERGEPAGQLAARKLEVERIETALGRAEQLEFDVEEALEGAA